MIHDNGNVSIGRSGSEDLTNFMLREIYMSQKTFEARTLSLIGSDTHQTDFHGYHEGTNYGTYTINVPDNKVVVGLVAKRYRHAHGDKDFYTFALKYK